MFRMRDVAMCNQVGAGLEALQYQIPRSIISHGFISFFIAHSLPAFLQASGPTLHLQKPIPTVKKC